MVLNPGHMSSSAGLTPVEVIGVACSTLMLIMDVFCSLNSMFCMSAKGFSGRTGVLWNIITDYWVRKAKSCRCGLKPVCYLASAIFPSKVSNSLILQYSA